MAGIQKDGGGQPHAQQPPQPGGGPAHVKFEVTEENVVDLAVTFQQASDCLFATTSGLKERLRITEPWLGDPVSAWAKDQLNEALVDSPNSLANVVTDTYNEYKATAQQLRKIADQYGKTEEFNAAMMRRQGGQQ